MMPNGQILAYMGDAVYEMYIRRAIIEEGSSDVNVIHQKVVNYTKAASQAAALTAIKPHLSETEWAAVLKGRNAKISKKPKHIDLQGYLYATGLEALFGTLYFEGKHERIEALCALILKL